MLVFEHGHIAEGAYVAQDQAMLGVVEEGGRVDESRRLRVAVRRIGTIIRGKQVKLIGASAPIVAGWDQLRSRG